MILFDTNVVSEPMKPKPDANVVRWLNRQNREALFLSSISWAELIVGVARLPEGKRKVAMDKALREFREKIFGPRILDFDERAAEAFGEMVSYAQSQGNTIGFADGQIAAIAKVHGFVVATRDTAPFIAAGVEVINPWEGVAA